MSAVRARISVESAGLRVTLHVRVSPEAACNGAADPTNAIAVSTLQDRVTQALPGLLPALNAARCQFETSLAQAWCELLAKEGADSKPRGKGRA